MSKSKNKSFFTSAFENTSVTIKSSFLACLISGLIIHIFAFTNLIPNSDGISRLFDAQQMTVSGRWFLHFASAFNGYTQLPAFIGFISVLFMAIASALVCKILDIKNPIIAAVCGVLMIAFPSVAFTYSYMFTASAYFFAILLAVVSVWIFFKYKFGFIFSALILACSIGTYQAYLGVALSLVLIKIILFAFEEKSTVKDTLLLILKAAVFFILSVLAYWGILKFFLWAKDLQLLSYLGMDSFGNSLSFSKILSVIVNTYKQFIGYFFIGRSFSSYTDILAIVLNSIIALFALISLIRIIVSQKGTGKAGKTIIVLILCALSPFALNFASVLSNPTPIMKYSLVFTYILAMVLIDTATKDVSFAPISLRTLGIVCSVVIIVSSSYIDNLCYLVSQTAHRSTESFATRLVERIESTKDYKNDLDVYIIGGFPDDIYYNDISVYSKVDHYSCLSSSVIPLNKHIYYYLNDWLNVQWKEPDEESMIDISESEEFKKAPKYPDDGSVYIEDGKVIVKLADEYTPKSDYEIQYEHRK